MKDLGRRIERHWSMRDFGAKEPRVRILARWLTGLGNVHKPFNSLSTSFPLEKHEAISTTSQSELLRELDQTVHSDHSASTWHISHY